MGEAGEVGGEGCITVTILTAWDEVGDVKVEAVVEDGPTNLLRLLVWVAGGDAAIIPIREGGRDPAMIVVAGLGRAGGCGGEAEEAEEEAGVGEEGEASSASSTMTTSSGGSMT